MSRKSLIAKSFLVLFCLESLAMASPVPANPVPTTTARPQRKTLFSRATEHGVYGSVLARGGGLATRTGMLMGGRVGWLINHSLSLGAAGHGLVTPLKLDAGEVEVGYGGAQLEYRFFPNSVAHFSAGTLLGAGSFRVRKPARAGTSNSVAFVVEPELAGIINLSETLQTGLTASYRVIRGYKLSEVSVRDMEGFAGGAFLSLGFF